MKVVHLIWSSILVPGTGTLHDRESINIIVTTEWRQSTGQAVLPKHFPANSEDLFSLLIEM